MNIWLSIWYWTSSFILGVLLFWQVRKFMTAISVNKLQRKHNRPIKDDEMEKIKKRITVIAGFISMAFAYIFNRYLLFKIF